jgi:hypothetical protein
MNEAVHVRRIRQARTPHRHPPHLRERESERKKHGRRRRGMVLAEVFLYYFDGESEGESGKRGETEAYTRTSPRGCGRLVNSN